MPGARFFLLQESKARLQACAMKPFFTEPSLSLPPCLPGTERWTRQAQICVRLTLSLDGLLTPHRKMGISSGDCARIGFVCYLVYSLPTHAIPFVSSCRSSAGVQALRSPENACLPDRLPEDDGVCAYVQKKQCTPSSCRPQRWRTCTSALNHPRTRTVLNSKLKSAP